MAIGTFNYPLTLGNEVAAGQHYMLINSYESINSVQGSTQMISSIALYIPPDSLTTTIAQSYGDIEMGALIGAAGGTGQGGPPSQDMSAKIATNYQNTSTTGAWDSVKGTMSTIFSKPQAAQNFMAAGAGLARNKHMSLAYKGPGPFRTHTFTFNFFPKEKAEADMIKSIVNDFKNGSTARMSGGTITDNALSEPFFASPRHYKIKFMMGGGKENEYLHQIGTSVITTMTVNHDPQSVVGFHKDGSPVQTRLALSFQEIEYITSTDKEGKINENIDMLGNSHDKQIRDRRNR